MCLVKIHSVIAPLALHIRMSTTGHERFVCTKKQLTEHVTQLVKHQTNELALQTDMRPRKARAKEMPYMPGTKFNALQNIKCFVDAISRSTSECYRFPEIPHIWLHHKLNANLARRLQDVQCTIHCLRRTYLTRAVSQVLKGHKQEMLDFSRTLLLTSSRLKSYNKIGSRHNKRLASLHSSSKVLSRRVLGNRVSVQLRRQECEQRAHLRARRRRPRVEV